MRKLLYVTLTAATALGFYGCSMAEVEKKPVVIEDTADDINSDYIPEQSPKAISDSNGTAKDGNDTTSMDPDASTDTNDISDAADDKTDTTNQTNTDTEEIKKMVIEIEGMKEDINARIHKNQSLGYQIAYDADRFKLSSKDGVDSFTAENPNPEIYPYVYVNISKNFMKQEDYLRELKANLNKEYSDVEQTEKVKLNDYYTVDHFVVRNGKDWNSVIRHYYIVNTGECNYVIETQFFLEAEEGYGARIKAMFETFLTDDIGC